MTNPRYRPFNSPLETGIRTLAILVSAFPRTHDLHRLVQYDYLVVHSADAAGPSSLHPPLPLRSGELLVRRDIIERGLRLMMSRYLVRQEITKMGFFYGAEDRAGSFLNNLRAAYIEELRTRATWVVATFDGMHTRQLDELMKSMFRAWTSEFQPVQLSLSSELLP